LIDPGNVVLFERLHGPADVRSAGIHFVSRFEKIKDIVNLEEQIGEFKENEREIKAITKDGIPVTVKNVRFRYRLHPGRRYSGPVGRAWEDPYPFSVKAVLNMAYNRNVRADGLATWEEAIKFALDTAISDFIRKNTIDQLVAPGLVGGDPRQTIRKALDSSDIRNRLRNLGAELLFYDIGHFEIPEKGVEEQRLSNWQAKWMGTANLIRSDAEAQRLAYQELGRAEAQAEMLMSIARGLQDAGLEDKGNSKENLQNIILMRTAQILEALTEQNRQPPKDASGSTSPSK
jgi:regulator of protease activity HflC (stomatin/prohibitin superfamily)